MKNKKLQSIIALGLVILLSITFAGIRGLAQEADGDIYLPLIFRPNGEPAPTKTPIASISVTVSPSVTTTPTKTPIASISVTVSPSVTATPTGSVTIEPTPDCALLDMSDFGIRQYNRPVVKIINNNPSEVTITRVGLEWVSANAWAHALDYDDIHVDWFKWEGDRFYEGDDFGSPTYVDASIVISPNSEGEWEIDFDWIGETDWAFLSEFGLTQENFGFFVEFDDGCILHRPEVVSLPPGPTPPTTVTPTPIPTQDPSCADYTFSDFEIGPYNRPAVTINNNAGGDVYVEQFNLTWQSAYDWAIALGYNDIRVDWFEWNGSDEFYSGNDPDTPTFAFGHQLVPAGGSGTWETDMDWSGEVDGALVNEFGLTPDNFGFWVLLDNGCVLEQLETYSPPPEIDCGVYSAGDFYFGDWGHVFIDITNDDPIGIGSTEVISIELDWDYAEAYDELADPVDELNVDYFRYGGRITWGDGDPLDYDSTTHTDLDHPETFPGYWSPDLPPFEAGQTYTLDADFDNEWPDFSTDLLPTDFGVTFTLTNGCTLVREATPRPVPDPQCALYTMSDFTIGSTNRIETFITNNDILPTEIERIVLDWDYAEAVSDLMIGPDDLYTDWFEWDYGYIWSNGWDNVGDLSSVTDTDVDSPEVWVGPDDFAAGDTVNFEVDFDFALTNEYDDALLSWGLIPDDFGATFYFTNGCVLEKPAVPRPVVTPSPLDVVLVIDISESMAWDAPDGDPMRDPAQCNAADPGGSDGLPGECHPFEEVKAAVHEFVTQLLDHPAGLENDRISIVTFGNGWSADPNMGTHYRTTGWTNNVTATLAIIDNLSVFEPDPCFFPDGSIRTEFGPCIRYVPPDSLNFIQIFCISCLYSDPVDYSPKSSTNIGGGLLFGGNISGVDVRPGADRVVILITDGQANATMAEDDDDITDPATYPMGHCPPDSVLPLCQDEDISTRHPYTDTAHYDADDYARDLADYVGCDPLNPSPDCLLHSWSGMGATIFAVGFGPGVLDNTNELNDLPYGVALLRYLAAVGDDGDPATDPCADYWDDPAAWEEWCGNYYFVSDGDDLPMALDHIFARLILGLILE